MQGRVVSRRKCAQMNPKRRSAIIHVIWAIATVLPLLWAVQTFRAGQAHREAQRRLAEDSRAEARANERANVRSDSAHVALALRGGAGFGDEGNKLMTSVFIDINNDTDQPVMAGSVALDESLRILTPIPTPIRIKPRQSWTQQFDIDPADIPDDELSGRPCLVTAGP